MATQESLSKLFKEKYNLSKAHLEYLKIDFENITDVPKDQQKAEIEKLEKEIASADFLLLDKIGSGGFGNVFKGVRKKDNKAVAIKIIDLEDTKDDISSITKEISALANGKQCEQLTNYFGSCIYGTKLWIVMEYIDGGSVLDRMKKAGKPLSEKEIAVIVREVLLGLQYLAKDERIHRDIKAANILLSNEGQVKLADFGATGQLTDTMTKCNTFVGSPYWMAPEVMTQNKYDGKADIWSLGITCIEMATGKPPNATVHPMQVIALIPNKPPPKLTESETVKFSDEFKEFVSRCLVKKATERPNINELLRLNFVKRAGKTKLLKLEEEVSKSTDE